MINPLYSEELVANQLIKVFPLGEDLDGALRRRGCAEKNTNHSITMLENPYRRFEQKTFLR